MKEQFVNGKEKGKESELVKTILMSECQVECVWESVFVRLFCLSANKWDCASHSHGRRDVYKTI